MPDNVDLIITEFDYNQYRRGTITTRLRLVIEYIIYQSPYTVRPFLKHQRFELQGDASADERQVKLTVVFPELDEDDQKKMEEVNTTVILKKE